MSDLIRRSDILESLGDRPENWMDSAEEIQACADWDAFHGIVTRLPAVDVVEVCRCSDCVHFEPFRRHDGFCKIDGMLQDNDFFCKFGQRREEGGNT